jgi:HemY protein
MIVRLLLVTLLALVAAVLVGHFIAVDPGFIVIGIGGKVLRTTFAFFVIVVLGAVLALYIGLRVLSHLLALRGRFGRWSGDYRRRRAYRSLADGLLARAAGEHARAERLFSLGADDHAQPEVHYLAAAEAAQALHANGRRDNYLKLARDLKPDAAPALEMQRAAWLLDQDHVDEAAALIDELTRTQVSTPALLSLRLRLLQRRGDRAGILHLMPELRRDRVMSHDEANVLERDCAVAVLRDEALAADALTALWEGWSKSLRATPQVLAAYVHALCRVRRDDEAERLLSRQLERVWNSDLAALYGDIECQPPARQLRRVEQWASQRDSDPGLRLARARLAIRSQLWGPARTQLEYLVAEHPLPLFYRLLAEVADGAGDTQAAQRYRKRGLELATA